MTLIYVSAGSRLSAEKYAYLRAIIHNAGFITQLATSAYIAKQHWIRRQSFTIRMNMDRIETYGGDHRFSFNDVNRILTCGPVTPEESIFFTYFYFGDEFMKILNGYHMALQAHRRGKDYSISVTLPYAVYGPLNPNTFNITKYDFIALRNELAVTPELVKAAYYLPPPTLFDHECLDEKPVGYIGPSVYSNDLDIQA